MAQVHKTSVPRAQLLYPQRLPYDILERVFRHLRVRDYSKLRSVSHALSDCVDYFQTRGISMLAIPAAEDELARLRVKRGRRSKDLRIIATDKELDYFSHLELMTIDFDNPDGFTAQECHVKEMEEVFINVLNHIKNRNKRPVLNDVELNYLSLSQGQKLIERIGNSNLRFDVRATGEKGVADKTVIVGNKSRQLTLFFWDEGACLQPPVCGVPEF
ncbi:hypothetical protein TRICI_006297 [Trichomonascus ciferrii]|uniref:F-box domain-containing protein n=1 Tax=Trichomonascus ciferrii TaxID=44093 RepID=A0A642UN66_9ASCO|nr:hypothetical protein TRICI_006297 [Trichomonascus ciferrii]